MAREPIKLGDLARDIITGFEGIVVARTQWLSSCDRVTLQPREMKDGKRVNNCTFDLHEVELVESGVVAPLDDEAKAADKVKKPLPDPPAAKVRRTGGPTPDPVRAQDPGR